MAIRKRIYVPDKNVEESMDPCFFRLEEEKLHLVVADEDRGEEKNIKNAIDFRFVKVEDKQEKSEQEKQQEKSCPVSSTSGSGTPAGPPGEKSTAAMAANEEDRDEPASKKKKPEDKEEEKKPIDNSKEANIEAEVQAAQRAVVTLELLKKQFRDMLAEKDVSAFSTWQKELHKIAFDPRYHFLTLKEKKQVFEQYKKERVEEERHEKHGHLREKEKAKLHGKYHPPPGPGMAPSMPPPNISVPPPTGETQQNQGDPGLQELRVETKTAEGKVYCYNAKKQESAWTKPDNLKIITQAEVEQMAAQSQAVSSAPGPTTAAHAAQAQDVTEAELIRRYKIRPSFVNLGTDCKKENQSAKTNTYKNTRQQNEHNLSEGELEKVPRALKVLNYMESDNNKLEGNNTNKKNENNPSEIEQEKDVGVKVKGRLSLKAKVRKDNRQIEDPADVSTGVNTGVSVQRTADNEDPVKASTAVNTEDSVDENAGEPPVLESLLMECGDIKDNTDNVDVQGESETDHINNSTISSSERFENGEVECTVGEIHVDKDVNSIPGKLQQALKVSNKKESKSGEVHKLVGQSKNNMSADTEGKEMSGSPCDENVGEEQNKCFPCVFCKTAFSTSLYNQIHILRVHGRNKLTNIQVHDEQLRMQGTEDCRKRDWENRPNSNLQTRKVVGINTSSELTKSKVCKQSVTRKINTTRHSGDKPYNEEKPYKCKVCGYAFKYNSRLKRHLKTHNGDRRYKCEVCRYACKEKHDLKVHMRTHNGDKPYKCEICGYAFTCSNNKQRHLRIHSLAKPYECSICGYACKQRHSLQRHSRIHSLDKPYTCDTCGYACKQIYDLKRHLKRHSEDKPYKCDVCGYSCKQRYDLQRHLKRHSEDKRYLCEICGYACKLSNTLQKHLTTHLGDKL